MAAPWAHIFLAILMLNGLFKGLFNEKEFIIGTSFPDIRYLKVVERAETHVTNVSIEDIMREKNSFRAGLLFHSFVDQVREKYMVELGLYELLPSFRFVTQSLKFAKDQILRSVCDASLYVDHFDEILPDERAYGIDEHHLKLWHRFLQNYLSGDYSIDDIIMKYFDLHEPDAWAIKRWFFSWFYARKIKRTITLIKKNRQMRQLLLDFYLNFSQRYSSIF